MATFARYAVFSGAAVASGLFAFSYTDPKWTQHRFTPTRCPPLVHDRVPTREACVAKMRQHTSVDAPLDVLVVGGGSVGTGAALDAATRGLDVGLVEMYDYASETSSRSTKLIHGGIRYLEKAVFQLDPMQLKLVAEALSERSIMLHQAPHLCQGLPTIIPCYHAYDIGMFWAGTKLYDFIAALYGGTIKYSDFVRPYETMRLYPKLRKTDENNRALLGAVRYYDGQMNDARLCFAVAQTAASYGAAMVNYAKVTEMEVVKNAKGESVVRSTIHDSIANKTMTVYSKSIINAGGPFTNLIQKTHKGATPSIEMVPARGSHVVLDRAYCPRTHEGMVVPSNDGRVVFAIPWLGGCLAGTTDLKCEVTDDPRPTQAEVDFLIKNLEHYVGPIPPEALKSTWAGIRPLAMPKKREGQKMDTQNIVREHLIAVDAELHMLSVAGGKWTTYRKISEEVVDELVKTLLQEKKATVKPCCTSDLVLIGARYLDQVPESSPANIPDDVHRHWRKNYGDRYTDISNMANANKAEYLARLTEGSPVTEAEVVWAAREEHCEHVMDFLARRTRMAFVNANHAEASIPRVAELMGSVKGWSKSKIKEEKDAAYTAMGAFRAN